jgi:hypothetical protein
MSQSQFAKKYGFGNKGLSPKMLKIGKDYIEEEIQALFGPCNTKNGYHYCFSNDERLITSI